VIPIFWVGLLALLVFMLVLDLGVFHRRAHAQTTGEALAWSLFWIATGLCFNAFVYFAYEYHWMGIGQLVGHELDGRQAAIEFFTAYVVEKSLSLDNIFVIAMIFTYFEIPLENQHRVLFWGVAGALVMRAFFIVSGLALVEHFAWTTYVFGAVLLATAVKMFIERDDNIRPEKNALVCLVEKHFAVTSDFHGPAFFARCQGRRVATPLFLALVVVETSDLLFAIDSIPAVIAVTRDTFIAFSSNAFAILGLRSLYFVIAPFIERFHYMKQSLIVLLGFIGVKMMFAHYVEIPIAISLGCIAMILGAGVIASIWTRSRLSPEVEAATVEQLVKMGLRTAWKMVVGVVGVTVLALGLLMVALPGPAFVVIPIGLMILGSEFVWARHWLARIRELGNGVLNGKAKADTAAAPVAIRKVS